MLVTIIEILDMTIVNVALPNMMGSLGANTEQITWVLTSYIVSAAIVMLLTGFLVARLGQKRLLIINIIGFLLCSIFCGLSTNLNEIVIFRTLQGVFGASLAPLSQLILSNTFSVEERGKAMAIWGMGIMVAPVLGPTLGGYITEVLNWRWIFYINIPVCLIALWLTLRYIPETERSFAKIDWTGLLLMAVGVGGLQIFLDQGNQYDWFQSHYIIGLFLVFALSLGFFIVRGIYLAQKNIIDLHLFKDRNFATATLMMSIFSIGMFGTLALQPLFMENILGYSTSKAGLIMAPRGITSALAMMAVIPLLRFVDARKIVAGGVLLSALGSYLMSHFNADVDAATMITAGAIQGFGIGLFFVPLSTMAFLHLKPVKAAEATGLFNFGRSLGSSIGVSILSTLLTRETQVNWNRLGAHINLYNPNLNLWLHHTGFSLPDPHTLPVLAQTLSLQASTVAFTDCFHSAMLFYLAMLPLLILMRPRQKISRPH
jgi:DHA2 family multidrug resistance protein